MPPASPSDRLSPGQEDPLLPQEWPPSDEESDSEIPESGFSFSHVPSLVKSVRAALDLEEPETPPTKQKKLFKQLSSRRANFPFLAELDGIIQSEWSRGDNRRSLFSKVAKLCPFKAEEIKHLDTPPRVDASLMRLVRHVTLPLEDSVSFRDPLDKRMDLDLKKIYLTAGLAARPSMALATISKALETWADSVELSLARVSDEAARSSPIQEIRMASAFLGEASLDLIRMTARIMLLSVTAKRALWLRPWKADPASKQAWCRIPFEGSTLFGNKLKEAITASGGKSGLIPQDRRQRRFPSFGRQQTDRAREARTYKPGREFNRPWRARGASTSKGTRGPTGSKKPF